jgi:hypothetical protein
MRTEIYLPSNPISNLVQKAQDVNTSIDAFLLAAITQVRARFILSRSPRTRIPHLIIGVYRSNRAPFSTDLSTLCAPTLNLVPLLIKKPLDVPLEELAHSIQKDLQQTGEAGMISTTLQDIYNWTGKRVDFWVNIVKEEKEHALDGMSSTKLFTPSQDPTQKRFAVVKEIPNENIAAKETTEMSAYIVSSH